MRGFERNPFAWRHGAGRPSHWNIGFLWCWTTGDGSAQKVFEFLRLDNVLQRPVITISRGMNEQDAHLYASLCRAAEMETKTHKAPCRYLGLEIAPGGWEPDPTFWPEEALADRKSHVNVSFEWQYVTSGAAKHKVTCQASHAVGGVRGIPLNPFKYTCPSNLTFSIDFFDNVAKLVSDGIQFKGVVFEGECSEIKHQVPNEGKDVQDELVHMPQFLPDAYREKERELSSASEYACTCV